MPAKLALFLKFFIFCSLTTPILSGMTRISEMICGKFKGRKSRQKINPETNYESGRSSFMATPIDP
jgi:hypothetical protein